MKARAGGDLDEALRRRVEAWIADDPDPETAEELRRLLRAGDAAALEERFAGFLQFGTAGLRGLLGGGPHRMNRAVVIRATAGLCAYLGATCPEAAERGVVIGYDARRKSRRFAEDVAEVVLGAGLKARLFDAPAPTPLGAFALLDQGAAAAVVVTASHNPPEYNGYKVFWGDGAQIVPPHDAGIASAIAGIPAVSAVVRTPMDEAPERVVRLGAEIGERYLAALPAYRLDPEGPRDLRIVTTALHGVGDVWTRRALADAGFEDVHAVAAQAEPDGRFPTVAFPNPEEAGALDLAKELAEETGAELVLANDPDADRLAALVRHEGRLVALNGNEIGCLLAHFLLEQGPRDGERLVLSSVVSSPWLLRIGAHHGARAEQTLTGHKWIHARALELEQEGARFVYGYEEALGYAVGPVVRDKDGVHAAVAFAELTAWCRARGRTLVDELARMAQLYGLYRSRQLSRVLPGTHGRAAIDATLRKAREAPLKSLGDVAVVATSDFATGERREADGTVSALRFPRANLVRFDLEGGHRAMLRPSGTEPKVKYYFDVRVEVAEGEALAAATSRGEALLDAIERDFRRALE
ncbi:MAG: phospho-sugar mutase [Myxococcota bacterium]